jgi:hypothetical protein
VPFLFARDEQRKAQLDHARMDHNKAGLVGLHCSGFRRDSDHPELAVLRDIFPS